MADALEDEVRALCARSRPSAALGRAPRPALTPSRAQAPAPASSAEAPPADPAAEGERLLLKARNLSQRAAAYAKRLAAEADSLGEEVASLERALARAGAAAAAGGGAAPPAAARALDAARRVLVGDGPGGDLRKLRAAPRPALLSAFLGASTSVASLRRDQALRIREEYARFRNRSAYAMFAAAVALLVTTERAARVAAAGGPRSLSPVAAAGFQVRKAASLIEPSKLNNEFQITKQPKPTNRPTTHSPMTNLLK
jgi:hypothetical protein